MPPKAMFPHCRADSCASLSKNKEKGCKPEMGQNKGCEVGAALAGLEKQTGDMGSGQVQSRGALARTSAMAWQPKMGNMSGRELKK